jgi:predicted outer membrane protein
VSERRLYGLRAGALLVLLAAPFATAQDAYPADITLASSRLIAAWGRMQALDLF